MRVATDCFLCRIRIKGLRHVYGIQMIYSSREITPGFIHLCPGKESEVIINSSTETAEVIRSIAARGAL